MIYLCSFIFENILPHVQNCKFKDFYLIQLSILLIRPFCCYISGTGLPGFFCIHVYFSNRACPLMMAGSAAHSKWTVLGQSFGGFCLLRYLSAHPEGVEMGLFTGGLPPLKATAEDVYKATIDRVAERNRRYYERFPGDAAKIRRIVEHLRDANGGRGAQLPSGGFLSVERFLSLGLTLGSGSGLEQMHFFVDEAFDDAGLNTGASIGGARSSELSKQFLGTAESMLNFDASPIYAILHEAIYCQNNASNWAADRVVKADSRFDWRASLKDSQPVLFTGEMVFPWMFEGAYPGLASIKEAADRLAKLEWCVPSVSGSGFVVSPPPSPPF